MNEFKKYSVSHDEFEKVFQELGDSEEDMIFFIEFAETMLNPKALNKLKYIQETHPSEAVKKRATEAIVYLSPLLESNPARNPNE